MALGDGLNISDRVTAEMVDCSPQPEIPDDKQKEDEAKNQENKEEEK